MLITRSDILVPWSNRTPACARSFANQKRFYKQFPVVIVFQCYGYYSLLVAHKMASFMFDACKMFWSVKYSQLHKSKSVRTREIYGSARMLTSSHSYQFVSPNT